ncbi:hypothetical protein ACHHRT_02220 [Desulfurivibrio sp. D14AmB]|uniref:hypothetical protein n=1 Tax=Desulfurivibrio sp. D14AmB TaxID=3374370 RepID=UPI00376EA33C
MAPEIGSHQAPASPQLTQALVGRGSTRTNGELSRSGRQVRQAESQRQDAEEQVRQAQRNKQQAIERLRQARADEQKAEQQLREARSRRLQAVGGNLTSLRGTVVNILI